METYSVEKIQDEWVVKDASNNVVAAFLESSAFNTAKEAEKYAERLNDRVCTDRYRAMSSVLNSVGDHAIMIQEFTKTLYNKMVDTENRSSTLTIGDTLEVIRKELDSLKQAVAALPSVKEFSAMNKLIAEKGITRLRGY